MLSCPSCLARFYVYGKVEDTFPVPSQWSGFACGGCGKIFKGRGDIITHILKQDSGKVNDWDVLGYLIVDCEVECG